MEPTTTIVSAAKCDMCLNLENIVERCIKNIAAYLESCISTNYTMWEVCCTVGWKYWGSNMSQLMVFASICFQ